jgi:hypothetical protein
VSDRVSRVWRFLRSRKLAVGLLLACTAWSVVGTVVPQTSRGAEKADAWARSNPALEAIARPLGLHAAYSSPIFLAALGLLALSTTVCSIERTRWSRVAARPSAVTERARDRLAREPYEIAKGGVGLEDVRSSAEAGLRAAGLRVTAVDGVLVADGGRFGVYGSPIFHWSLAALLVVIALGQLTRAEGLIGVRVGERAKLEPSRFGRYDPGPLYRQRVGDAEVEVFGFVRDYKTGDYSRGPSPHLRLHVGGAVVADQWVYPNNPLRYGSLLVHQVEYGVSPVLTALNQDGISVGEASGFSDWDEAAPDGVTPVAFTLQTGDPQAAGTEVTVTLEAAREGTAVIRAIPPPKRVRILWRAAGADEASRAELLPGESIAVPGGSLRLDDVKYYARLSIVDDWSVYPVYALFVTATIGISLAVFAPRRAAWVLVEEGPVPGRVTVRVLTRHWRGDPSFRVRIEDALHAAIGESDQDDDGGDA